jgi:hypothetical protein
MSEAGVMERIYTVGQIEVRALARAARPTQGHCNG